MVEIHAASTGCNSIPYIYYINLTQLAWSMTRMVVWNPTRVSPVGVALMHLIVSYENFRYCVCNGAESLIGLSRLNSFHSFIQILVLKKPLFWGLVP